MLESPSLLLLPWSLDRHGGTARWSRPVLGGAAGPPLGRIRGSAARRSWLTWFQACRLEVVETEDEAVLLTLVRSWGLLRLWDLYDAEESRIGSIYPPVLLDAEGVRRGYLEAADPCRGRVVGPGNRPLAEFTIDPDRALRLDFAAELEPNPFLRMLLLGGVLTLQPPPTPS